MSITKKQLVKWTGLLLLLWTISNTAWGNQSYYRDCSVKLSSPSTAQGKVYVANENSGTGSRKVTKPVMCSEGPMMVAELKNCMESTPTSTPAYYCRLLAYPKPGFTLAGFVTKTNYQAGRTSENYFVKNISGEKGRSGDLFCIAYADTLNDIKGDDPREKSNYHFSAKTTKEYYAIFRKAISKTVTVPSPGKLKELVAKINGLSVDKLVVKGSINSEDILFLSELVRKNNLIRIDLYDADIRHIPEAAFGNCSSLYEITFPHGWQDLSMMDVLGFNAFAYCENLMLPNCLPLEWVAFDLELHNYFFKNCISMKFESYISIEDQELFQDLKKGKKKNR